MRRLCVGLDPVVRMRQATEAAEPRLATVAVLAELAGADAVRVGVTPPEPPPSDEELRTLRGAVRVLELRLDAAPASLKPAFELRPERVVLAAEPPPGRHAAPPLERPALDRDLPTAVRELREAGLEVWVRVAPRVEAIKAAHAAGANGIELWCADAVDLPRAERADALEALADGARLALKLRLGVSAGGALDAGFARELLARAPGIEAVTVGRSWLARALMVGIERATAELRARLA